MDKPPDADKMSTFGIDLQRLALKWLYLFDEYRIWNGYRDSRDLWML